MKLKFFIIIYTYCKIFPLFYLSVFLFSFSILSCERGKIDPDDLYEIYKNQKESIELFKNVSITPHRNLYEIIWGKEMVSFIIKDEQDTRLIYMAQSEASFSLLEKKYNITRYQAERMLEKFYFSFQKLDILALIGGDAYTVLILTEEQVMIYIPQPNSLSETSKNQLKEREKNIVKRYDEHWFYYKPVRPYNFE